MEIDERINRILVDHEKRLSKLESVLGKPRASSTTKTKKVLADHIMILRANNFFSQPRTVEETHNKLQQTYPCEPNRVAVGLLRLANRKLLRKASKKVKEKKYLAYVW